MVKFTVELCLFFGVLIFCVSCKTQLVQSEVISTSDVTDHDITLKTKQICIDDLGYLYLISSQNELRQYDPNLIQRQAYSNERLGSITSIDTNNPLKLLLFYENYQTIIVLDNFLDEIGRYELFDLGFNEIIAVGKSNDNNIWIYDPIDYKLKKINTAGNLLVESITMYNEGLEYIRPTFLAEKGNKVFLYDSIHGFFVFDNLGQYLYKIPLTRLKSFQIVNEETIVFINDDMVQAYDLVYKTTRTFKPLKDYSKRDIQDMVISNKFIYLRDAQGVAKKPI